jgi:glycosyltransferase involved in cell wall biosynthesis
MKQAGPHRVLYVENGIGYGGAVICLRHLIRNLNTSRFKPIVVTSRDGSLYREIAREAPWYYFSNHVFEAEKLRSNIAQSMVSRKSRFIKLLALQTVARADDAVNLLPFMLRLLWLTLQVKPHLIHVNNEPLSNRAGMLIGKLLRIPVVAHVRNRAQKDSWVMKYLYRLPDHFIPVSHWVANNIKNLGVPSDKITVIYDGIELHKLNINADPEVFRNKHGLGKDSFVVGLVGLLIPWKGQNLFIDAAKQLLTKIPNLKMLVVGGTPDGCKDYENQLKTRVVSEGLDRLVLFTGHENDMPSVYKGLDVVVSASTSPEPLGTMVIETMAMARPLVVPNHGGGAEMNTHGETALVFDSGNAESLAQAIMAFYVDAGSRNKLGMNARDRALAAFDVISHARSVERVYESVLSRV